jgi:hypothetical protein
MLDVVCAFEDKENREACIRWSEKECRSARVVGRFATVMPYLLLSYVTATER